MIDFKNIEIRFGDFIAIPDLTMSIYEGEFFTLLGPSGCGKTTTLRSLVGFINPSKGKILIDDIDVTNVPIEDRKIGMVFQSYALFPTMTVYENIAFGLKVRKETKEEIDEKVKDIAQKVDLDEIQLKKKVSELSGGQQQRVGIARAVAMSPEVILLDEPTSALDPELIGEVLKVIKDMVKENMTMIIVTHEMQFAREVSDYIVFIDGGTIIAEGKPEEIFVNSKNQRLQNFLKRYSESETDIYSI